MGPLALDGGHRPGHGVDLGRAGGDHRRRVGATLTKAFLYNAIFFTYAIALTTFYHVASASVGLYLLPFAAGTSPARCCSAGSSTPSAARS
jgi:hypothetical protein